MTTTEIVDQLDIVERLTILLSCIDKDDEEMRGAYETVEDAADEIERLRDEVHFDDQTIKSLQVIKERLKEKNAQLRELLQKWLGNCFVDVYGNGVTFGMGVKKVWAETRAALREGE